MKLNEILSGNLNFGVHNLAPKSSFMGPSVKLPGIFDPKNRDVGRLSGTSAQTVVIKNTKTKQVVGNRTLYQKNTATNKSAVPYDDPKYGPVR